MLIVACREMDESGFPTRQAGKIIGQGSSGTVYVADATPAGYKPRGSYKAPLPKSAGPRRRSPAAGCTSAPGKGSWSVLTCAATDLNCLDHQQSASFAIPVRRGKAGGARKARESHRP